MFEAEPACRQAGFSTFFCAKRKWKPEMANAQELKLERQTKKEGENDQRGDRPLVDLYENFEYVEPGGNLYCPR